MTTNSFGLTVGGDFGLITPIDPPSIDEIRSAALRLHDLRNRDDIFSIGSDRLGIKIVIRSNRPVPDNPITSIDGVPVRWLTFAAAVQEYENGKRIPTTVHPTDSAGCPDADDPRCRECPGCGEMVSCQCGSD